VPAQLQRDAGLLTPYAVRHATAANRRPSSIARQRSLSPQPLSHGPWRYSNPDWHSLACPTPQGMGWLPRRCVGDEWRF
jgi:hypothetical protein